MWWWLMAAGLVILFVGALVSGSPIEVVGWIVIAAIPFTAGVYMSEHRRRPWK